MFQKLTLILSGLALVATSAALQPAHAADPAAQKEWTLLVFLNGNNNLDSFGAFNINQMEQIGSTDKINVVVQWASLENGKVQRLLVTKDNNKNKVTSPILQDMGQVDMGDWHNLVEFVRWGAENFPAKHYFVDVWNHGSGWHAIQSGQTRRGEFHPSDISWDDLTGNSITTKQLGQAMEEVARIIGHKVDLYGSDACLMGMAEVAGEMKDSVEIFAGSQELEPGAGWPYDDLLREWGKKEKATASDVAKILTNVYLKSYQGGQNGNQEVTFSAYDLTQSDKLYGAITQLGGQLMKLDSASRKAIVKATKASQNFFYDDYVDFGDFLNQVEKANVGKLEKEVIREARGALSSYVIANGVTQTYARATGVSIWIPNSMSTFNSYVDKYSTLQFQNDTRWADALRYILQDKSTESISTAPALLN